MRDCIGFIAKLEFIHSFIHSLMNKIHTYWVLRARQSMRHTGYNDDLCRHSSAPKDLAEVEPLKVI